MILYTLEKKGSILEACVNYSGKPFCLRLDSEGCRLADISHTFVYQKYLKFTSRNSGGIDRDISYMSAEDLTKLTGHFDYYIEGNGL